MELKTEKEHPDLPVTHAFILKILALISALVIFFVDISLDNSFSFPIPLYALFLAVGGESTQGGYVDMAKTIYKNVRSYRERNGRS